MNSFFSKKLIHFAADSMILDITLIERKKYYKSPLAQTWLSEVRGWLVKWATLIGCDIMPAKSRQGRL